MTQNALGQPDLPLLFTSAVPVTKVTFVVAIAEGNPQSHELSLSLLLSAGISVANQVTS